jgi:hypothetical protein
VAGDGLHEHQGEQDDRYADQQVVMPDTAAIKVNSSPAVTVCQAGAEARSRQMISPAAYHTIRVGQAVVSARPNAARN